ncbi:MAG: hypothetical protein ACKPKO_38930, partial [Candidatus Fonsibacter sp.]
EDNGTSIMIKRDSHALPVNIEYVANHASASEEAILPLGYHSSQRRFQEDAERTRNEAIVGVDQRKGSSGRGFVIVSFSGVNT